MGLSHEFQRPDRDSFLTYKCKHLIGYEEAKNKADIDEQGLFEDDDSMRFKMDLMYESCTFHLSIC